MHKSGKGRIVKSPGTREKRIASGFDRLILYEFEIMEEHRAHIETYLNSEIRSVQRRFKEASKLAADEAEMLADFLYEDYVLYAERFPKLQWYAQFLMVYSSFEHTLNMLCLVVQNRSDFRLSLKDVYGQGIVRARTYLEKVAGVATPFETAAWNSAILFGELRNAIAHASGEIRYDLKNQKSLAHRLQRIAGITLQPVTAGHESCYIILSAEFVGDAIKSLKSVLTDIANYKLYE